MNLDLLESRPGRTSVRGRFPLVSEVCNVNISVIFNKLYRN